MSKAEESTNILIVMEEELMIELIGEFAPERNRLIFAVSVEEALAHCEAHRPALVIVNAAAPELRSIAGKAATCGASLLGLGERVVDPEVGFDELVDPIEPAQVAAAARRQVKERRQAPRATLELPIEIEGVGMVTASRISARSLFIPGEVSLQQDQTVRIEISMEGERSSCDARVIRREAGEAEEAGVVLVLEKDADAVTSILENLIRQSILHQYLEQPLRMLGGAPKLSIARKIVDHARKLIKESPTSEHKAISSPVVEQHEESGGDSASIDEQWAEIADQWTAAPETPAAESESTVDESWEQIADDWEAVAQELGSTEKSS